MTNPHRKFVLQLFCRLGPPPRAGFLQRNVNFTVFKRVVSNITKFESRNIHRYTLIRDHKLFALRIIGHI